jgi:phage gpG-like protein
MSKFKFDRVIKNMEAVKREAPQILANQAQTFFADTFNKQGFTDGSLQKWKERKNDTKKRDSGRAILVKSGNLRKAVANSIRSATFDNIRLVVDGKFSYGKYHNEGTDKLPKREFMGDSKTLRKMQKGKLKKMIDKIWRG